MTVIGKIELGLLVLVLALWGYFYFTYSGNPGVKQNADNQRLAACFSGNFQIQTLAENLEVPWDMVFLPNGEALVTERPGRVRLLLQNGELDPNTLAQIDVAAVGEGGLLGITLDPQFSNNHFVYLYYTYRQNGNILNKVERYVYNSRQLSPDKVIIDGIPGSTFHNGGRIAFGPDRLLYITTGDAQNEQASQDIQSLAGKILRLDEEGQIPQDNPFGNEIYSLGHRNPQGLVWDDKNRLWATEHGNQTQDELNLIVPGKNYGWPIIRGEQQKAGMENPIIQSGNITWAPSGMIFKNNEILFTGLRGQALYIYNPQRETLETTLEGRFGRLRSIIAGPDGNVYLLTNNRDGRGEPTPGDDKILRFKIE